MARRAVSGEAIGVIDIGSNSGRLTVLQGSGQHLDVLADARSSLRLVHDVDHDGKLGSAAQGRIVTALRDFRAVAENAGARRIVTVATAAVREATNRAEVVERIQTETGLEVEVLNGDQEARYAMAGAVQGLPVDNGVVVDIGGGSMELCQFRSRRGTSQLTLPLGALRLTERFLQSEPPTPQEMSNLRDYVRTLAIASGIEPLSGEMRLICSGGTIRNLAKIDRATREYPIPRLHGYELTKGNVQKTATMLSGRAREDRGRISGVSTDRVDTIVAGALCALELMQVLNAQNILVAGRGLREGIALERLGLSISNAQAVRSASVTRLASRFETYDPIRSRNRIAMAKQLANLLTPSVGDDQQELLEYAAVVVDIGRSIDYFDRWEHAAQIVANADLYGFAHRDIVYLCAILESVGTNKVTLPGFRAFVTDAALQVLEGLATVLALADFLGHRLKTGALGKAKIQGSNLTLDVGRDDLVLDRKLEQRLRQSFGLGLRFTKG